MLNYQRVDLRFLDPVSLLFESYWLWHFLVRSRSAADFSIFLSLNLHLLLPLLSGEVSGGHNEATLSIVGGVCYGRARQQMEDEVDEQKTLLAKAGFTSIFTVL